MTIGGRKTDVFVGNIPYGTTEDQLHQIFTEAGRVKNIRIVVDHETGKPKGYAFVEFEDAATALSAIRNLNGHECNGRQLRVNYCSNSSLSKATKSDAQNGSGSQAANAHTIQDVVDGLTTHEMYDIVAGVKEFLENSTDQAKKMLTAHPQASFADDKVAEALLLMQIRLGMVRPGEIPSAVRPQPRSHLPRRQVPSEDTVSGPEQNSIEQQPHVPPVPQVQQQHQAAQSPPIVQQQQGHQHLQEPQPQYTPQPYQQYSSQTNQSQYTSTPTVQQPAQQSLGSASQQHHTPYGSHGGQQVQRSTAGGASGGRGEYSHYAPPIAQARGGVVDDKYGGLSPQQQQQLPQKQQQPPQQQGQLQLPQQQTRWPPSNSRDPRQASQQHQQPQQIARTHPPNVIHQQQQQQQQWGDKGLHKQQWGDQGAQLHKGTQSQQSSHTQHHYTVVPPQHQQQYAPTHLQQPQHQKWSEHGKQLAPHQQVGGNYPVGQQQLQQQQHQQQPSYSYDTQAQQNWRGHQRGGGRGAYG